LPQIWPTQKFWRGAPFVSTVAALTANRSTDTTTKQNNTAVKYTNQCNSLNLHDKARQTQQANADSVASYNTRQLITDGLTS